MDIMHLTRFLAYLDTLHDFCGPRNKLISRNDILKLVQGAFGYKSVEDVYPIIEGIGRPLYNRLSRQLHELYQYGSGSFSTFEQNTFDFVATIHKHHNHVDNVIEIEIPRNGFDQRLQDISTDYVLYDTSVLTYDYICKTLQKYITVTMATNWDGDGNNTNVEKACRDDRLNLEFALSKERKELSSFDFLAIKDDMIFSIIKNDVQGMSWRSIQEELSKTLNVRMYTIHMGKPQSMMNMFKRFLQYSSSLPLRQLVGRLTDVKRSGDWLQLEAMDPLSKIHKDMVLYTVDTPLAARCLLKDQVAIVTHKRPGNDKINVRIVGKFKVSDAIIQAKEQEERWYNDTMNASWILNRNDIPIVSRLLQQLLDLVNELSKDGWAELEQTTLDDTLIRKDMEYRLYPFNKLLQQKKNKAFAFLTYMYTALSSNLTTTKSVLASWRKTDKRQVKSNDTINTRKANKRQQQPDETMTLRKRVKRGGAVYSDFTDTIKRLQRKKAFFENVLFLHPIEMINSLVLDNLTNDITELIAYIKRIPKQYTIDIFETIINKGNIDDKCPIASMIYSTFMELHDIKDLLNRKTGRNISFRYGDTEENYDRLVNNVNSTYGDTVSWVKRVVAVPLFQETRDSISGSSKIVNDIMKQQNGGKGESEIQDETIIASAGNLKRESPFVRAVFDRKEYYNVATNTYVIPITEYFIAILIRDMFFERFKSMEFALVAKRGSRSPMSEPTVRTQSPVVVEAPLSASLEKVTKAKGKRADLSNLS